MATALALATMDLAQEIREIRRQREENTDDMWVQCHLLSTPTKPPIKTAIYDKKNEGFQPLDGQRFIWFSSFMANTELGRYSWIVQNGLGSQKKK